MCNNYKKIKTIVC